MQRYAPTMHDPQDDRKPWATMIPRDLGPYYLASDVDPEIEHYEARLAGYDLQCQVNEQRIDKLEKALREAVKWNWGQYAPPPDAEATVNSALS